jgi:hypothetical protein
MPKLNDELVTVWVSRKTRQIINVIRAKENLKSCDAVIEMLLKSHQEGGKA